jgi:hypothetical protein
MSWLIPRPLPAITTLAYTTVAEMYGIHGAFGKLCNLLQNNTTTSTTPSVNNVITLASYPRVPDLLVEIHLCWELGIGRLPCGAARM